MTTTQFYTIGGTEAVSKGVSQTQKKLTTTQITGVGSTTVDAVTGVGADGTHSFGTDKANKSTWSFNVNNGILVIGGGNGTETSFATSSANATVLTGVKATGTQPVATKASQATTVATGGLSETSVTQNVGGTIVTDAKSSGTATVATRSSGQTGFVTGGTVVTDITPASAIDVMVSASASVPTITLSSGTTNSTGAIKYVDSVSNTPDTLDLQNGKTDPITVNVSGNTELPK